MVKYESFYPKKSEEIFLRRQLNKWLDKKSINYKLILEKDESNSLYYCYFRVWTSKDYFTIFECAKNVQDLLLKALRKLDSRLGTWRFQGITH